jgi:hypothetical protein
MSKRHVLPIMALWCPDAARINLLPNDTMRIASATAADPGQVLDTATRSHFYPHKV